MKLRKLFWADLTGIIIAHYLIMLCRDKPVSEFITLFVFSAVCFYRIMSFLEDK